MRVRRPSRAMFTRPSDSSSSSVSSCFSRGTTLSSETSPHTEIASRRERPSAEMAESLDSTRSVSCGVVAPDPAAGSSSQTSPSFFMNRDSSAARTSSRRNSGFPALFTYNSYEVRRLHGPCKSGFEQAVNRVLVKIPEVYLPESVSLGEGLGVRAFTFPAAHRRYQEYLSCIGKPLNDDERGLVQQRKILDEKEGPVPLLLSSKPDATPANTVATSVASTPTGMRCATAPKGTHDAPFVAVTRSAFHPSDVPTLTHSSASLDFPTPCGPKIAKPLHSASASAAR